MLKGWDGINMFMNYICKLSLCVLLQDDQSTPWSSMENQMEDHMGGTHICWIQDNTLDLRKTHSKKMTREAITHGTITLPKHEH